MRETRSNNMAVLASDGKRSLRSAHNEEFYEIPMNIKKRTHYHEPNMCVKFSPIKRRSCLNAEDHKVEESGSRVKRKSRSLSWNSQDTSQKGPHVKKKVKKEGQFVLPAPNGMFNRTRRREANQASLKDAKSSIKKNSLPSRIKSTKSISISPNRLLRQSKMSSRATYKARSSKLSSYQCTASGSDQQVSNNFSCLRNGSANCVAHSMDEVIHDCNCRSRCQTQLSSSKSELMFRDCICGQIPNERKNGCISNETNIIQQNVHEDTAASNIRKHSISLISVKDSELHTDLEQPEQNTIGEPQPFIEQEPVGTESPPSVKNDANRSEEAGMNNDCTRSDTTSHTTKNTSEDKSAVRVTSGQNCSNIVETVLKKNDYGHDHELKNPTVADEFACLNLELLEDVDDGCDSFNYKKRKMNLRSSGVRCDPDFYTLSLDLMIKRPRLKSNAYRLPDNTFDVLSEKEHYSIKIQRKDGYEFSTAETKCLQNEIVSKPKESVEYVSADHGECKTDDSCKPTSNDMTTVTLPLDITLNTTTSEKPVLQDRNYNQVVEDITNADTTMKDCEEPRLLFTEEPPHGSHVYYFESDHAALKHNKNYHKLLNTVSILESQRQQCLSDIRALQTKKKEAICEPIAFVERLQKGVGMNFPNRLDVPDLPRVEWASFSSAYGTFDHIFASEVSPVEKPVTRKVKINFTTGVPLQPSHELAKKKDSHQDHRSETFRVAWAVEEQRKLEELLIKYPSEEIEFNRYRKIAAELGQRTPLQVQSRCQKYFIKLAKAGLPVPGHMPRFMRHRDFGCLNRHRRAKPHPQQRLAKVSTFFPTFHCPVTMASDEIEGHGQIENNDGWAIDQYQISDEEDVDEVMRYSDEYLEVLKLKRIRREQLRVFNKNGLQALEQHTGYSCDMCSCDPIQGVRFHCIDCPSEESVDLCQSCIYWQGQFETEKHQCKHRMEALYKAENFADDDYLKFSTYSGEYNYLDSNFLAPVT